MNVLIAVPTFENISPETFKSIYDIEKIPGWKFDFQFVKGYDCPRARNHIAHIAQEQKYEFVFMVDSDIILEPYCLQYLLQLEDDVVLGYYPRKNEPDKTDMFKPGHLNYMPEDRYSIEEIKNSEYDRIQINGGGFGCACIRTEIFNKLEYPYFCYVNYSDGNLLSEDLYFCSKATAAGYKIYLDTRVGCKHIAKKIINY